MRVSDLYDGGMRYQARDNVKNAAFDRANGSLSGDEYTGERNALSDRTPKPNVVRIEVLPSSVRREYLGSFYSIFDRVRAAVTNANAGADAYLPFYGIMTEGANPSFGVTAEWGNRSEGGFAGAVQLLREMASPVTALADKTGIGRTLNQVGTAALTNVDAARRTALHVAEQAGIMSNGVGTSTLKSFKKGNINLSYDIKVQWYLPEQEIPCMVGVERLVRMTYLRATEKGIAENIRQLMTDVATTGQNELASAGYDLPASAAGAVAGASGSDFAKSAADTIDKFTGNLWGTHYTIAPLPVRLCIGHTLDLQPMVITNVNFETSSEQFISEVCGAHLPLWVKASIKLEPWLIPSPGQQYMSFLGHEMFGKYAGKDKGGKK